MWFPNWPIQRLVVSEPELRRQRIVLFRRDSRRGQVVSAASPLAMQDGACVDMPLSEAKSLLHHSGDFHVFEHDPDADVEAIEVLADSLEAFSPIVGLETIDPEDFKRGRRPDSLLLEVTGLAHLFGDESQLARQLLVHCDALGFLPRIAIADTVGVAWAMARYFSGPYFSQHQQPIVLPPVTQVQRAEDCALDTVTRELALCRLKNSTKDGAANGSLGTGLSAPSSPNRISQPHADRGSPFPEPEITTNLIQQLPVEALRLQPTITDTLYQLGVETIGQLQRLSRNDLAMRFGDAIHRRLDQLTGKIEEPVIARRKPAEFVAEQLLEYPTHHRETIEVIIARLVGGLCEQMRSRQRGALEWTVRLVCQSGQPLEFRVNLFQPTAKTNQVMPLVEMQLEQVLSPHTRQSRKQKRGKSVAFRSAKIRSFAEQTATNTDSPKAFSSNGDSQPTGSAESAAGHPFTESQFHRYTTIQVQEIVVNVTSDVLLAQQQRQLFDENPRLDRQSLAHLINRLANRLGPSNVVYPALLSGAQPEYSFRLKPLVDPNRKHRRRKTRPPKQSHALARPFRLFHPPVRLRAEVRNAEPEMQNQEGSSSLTAIVTARPPALFRISELGNVESTQKVIAAWGPERIETGWWRGLTVCRDYWRVETETSQHFWVYRDLRNGDWFLHGEF